MAVSSRLVQLSQIEINCKIYLPPRPLRPPPKRSSTRVSFNEVHSSQWLTRGQSSHGRMKEREGVSSFITVIVLDRDISIVSDVKRSISLQRVGLGNSWLAFWGSTGEQTGIGLDWIKLQASDWIQFDWIELDLVGLGWIELDWNASDWIKSDWIESSWIGFSWIGIRRTGSSRIGSRVRLVWVRLDWIGLSWIGMLHIGLNRVGLEYAGLDWVGLDWVGLDQVRLDWIGLSWIGSSRTRIEWTALAGLAANLRNSWQSVESTSVTRGSEPSCDTPIRLVNKSQGRHISWVIIYTST